MSSQHARLRGRTRASEQLEATCSSYATSSSHLQVPLRLLRHTTLERNRRFAEIRVEAPDLCSTNSRRPRLVSSLGSLEGWEVVDSPL